VRVVEGMVLSLGLSVLVTVMTNGAMLIAANRRTAVIGGLAQRRSDRWHCNAIAWGMWLLIGWCLLLATLSVLEEEMAGEVSQRLELLLLGATVSAIFVVILVWNIALRRSSRLWFARLGRSDLIGHRHEDEIATVALRIVRLRARRQSIVVSVSVWMIGIGVVLRFANVEIAGTAGWPYFALFAVVLSAAVLSSISVVLGFLDPLADLAYRAWLQVESMHVGGSPPAHDWAWAPLALRATPAATLIKAQREMAWVASAGLRRVARSHPSGVDTAASSASLVAELAAPGASVADVHRGLVRVVEVLIEGVILDARPGQEMTASHLPPRLTRLRGLVVVAIAVMSGLATLAPKVVDAARDLL
jgi:hypothetical protein